MSVDELRFLLDGVPDTRELVIRRAGTWTPERDVWRDAHEDAASAYRVWQDPGMTSLWTLVMAFAFIVTALFARVFALKAQDRLIRLEERMRMRELLPPDMQARINDFTPDQLVAIRFASDAELPALAATVLNGNIQKRDEIKKLIKNWRADHCRV